MQQLANKPVFTLMDYRRRVSDSLAKSKKGLKSLISQNENDTQDSLQTELKVMNGMFDE